jgi:hypothetical protein
MVRIEQGYDLKKIVEALIGELVARKTLEQSTADNIIKEGKQPK